MIIRPAHPCGDTCAGSMVVSWMVEKIENSYTAKNMIPSLKNMKSSKSAATFVCLWFLGAPLKANAQIEFISADTTAQVATIAGTDRESGTTEVVAPGRLRNRAFAEVQQDSQGNGAGMSTSEVRVSTLDQPATMDAFMQVTASSLPQFNTGTFSEAQVTYFFASPTEVSVRRNISQGDTRFFVDAVRRNLTGQVTRVNVAQGLHTFEIEVVPGTAVVNPNLSVVLFASSSQQPTATPTPTPTATFSPDPITPTATIKIGVSNLLADIRKLSPTVNKKNKAAQVTLITLIRQQHASNLASLQALLPSLSQPLGTAINSASKSVGRAISKFRSAGSNSRLRATTKANLLSAARRLDKIVAGLPG